MSMKSPGAKPIKITAAKAFATNAQKDAFKNKFAEIVKQNEKLSNRYSIQFFDTQATSNYVITSPDGKSLNVIQYLSINELEAYRALKIHWYNS